jgi:dipeptidyl aminopeptidase/acylaminoacyl peptidase
MLSALCLALLAACASGPTHPALAQAQASGQTAPLLPVRQFVANTERVGGFVISPDGQQLLWSQTVRFDVGLAVRPVDRPEAVTTFATGNQGRGGGYYNWLPDSQHIVYSKDESGDENTRLLVLDASRSDLNPWAVTPARGVRAFVVGRGPAGSAAFLFASNQRDKATFDLYLADARTRRVSELARSDGRVLSWLVDSGGQLAGRMRQVGTEDGSDTVLEVRQPTGAWRPVKTVGGFDFLHVLRIDTQGGRAWALSNLGRDKSALVEMDLSNGTEKLLASHDRVDVTQVTFAARQGPPAGYVVDPGYPEVHYLDAGLPDQVAQATQRALQSGQMTTAPIFTRFQGSDDQARRVLLRSLSDFDVAELLWDRETGRVQRLNSHFPEVAEQLSPMQPFSFRASDGRTVHGYVIRPRGISGPVPMVLDIHGGPWVRDHWAPATYNTRQLLANRGYAVMLLNYRGSTGYGRDHMWAGAREYAGRLQQDIAEGAQWAVDQGIADPQRMAVMGASFGGFSVLSQLVQKRHDYRCGINVVGVADWARLMDDWPPFWRNRHYFSRFYGDPHVPAERAEMLRNSPISQLDRITAPLLVIHGANDIRVLRRDSDEVVAALRQRGHPVDYLLFNNEGHSISRWRNRLAMWRTIEDTLADCLGGRSAGFDYYELMPR